MICVLCIYAGKNNSQLIYTNKLAITCSKLVIQTLEEE